jgi:hypothetical protein
MIIATDRSTVKKLIRRRSSNLGVFRPSEFPLDGPQFCISKRMPSAGADERVGSPRGGRRGAHFARDKSLSVNQTPWIGHAGRNPPQRLRSGSPGGAAPLVGGLQRKERNRSHSKSHAYAHWRMKVFTVPFLPLRSFFRVLQAAECPRSGCRYSCIAGTFFRTTCPNPSS